MKYSILVVVHEQVELTRACIDSIRRFSPAGDFELLVLDNASKDGTRDYLRGELERHANTRVFFNERNGGFMTPMNYLARQARGRYLLILNNDLKVCPGWLARMETEFEGRPRMALVGLKQNCGEIGSDGNGLPVRTRLEYVEASCMMVPRWIVEKHGLFDDDYYYFGYYEDSDLSLRLRERGFEIATVDLPIVHRRASTMRRLKIDVEGIRARNSFLFRKRWARYLKTRSFEKEVLFRRSSALGDVIMATPIVRAYKERFPFSRITFATRYPEVLEKNPDVERVIDLNDWKVDPGQFHEFYDLDLAYEKKPAIPVVKAYAETVGVPTNGHRPKLYAAEYEKKDPKLAVFHAERIANWPGRNAPVAAFRHAAEGLKRRGYRVVEIGKSQTLVGVTEYVKTTFPELCSLISSAAIFVGQDSAPFHVAQTYEVPAVVTFGAIKPELRDYSGKVFPVVVPGLECLGCHHIQPAPRTIQECLREKPVCMERITGAMIERQIEGALAEEK